VRRILKARAAVAAGPAVAAGLVLAGCATPPPPPPLLTYAGSSCAAAPNLAGAISLTPKKPKTDYSVPALLDGAAPCLQAATGPTPYRVFALPPAPESKMLTVGAMLEGVRLVPPLVAVLDAQGHVTRSFSAQDLYFRGAVLSVMLQPRPGEAYVLVTTDRSRIGQRYDSIAIGTSTTSVYVAPAGSMSWTTGTDQAQSRTFSYEGALNVDVHDLAKAKPKS
jgi:hypothetical protein